MITRQYFAIRPTLKLTQLLAGFELMADVARSELLVKKNNSRQRAKRDDDLALIKAAYCRGFLDQTFTGTQDERVELAKRIESEGFDTFWTVEVFNDCDDVEDLIAEVRSVEQTV